MHMLCEIWFPEKPKDVKKAVERVMAPYYEGDNRDGWWDWFQLGARYVSAHKPDYDPNKDPEHQEVCNLCKGTGTRPDMDCGWCGGCNGCKGTGTAIKWPTQWRIPEHVCMELKGCPDDLTAYTVIAALSEGDAKPAHAERWDRKQHSFVAHDLSEYDGKVKEYLKAEHGIEDKGFLVSVDYHS